MEVKNNIGNIKINNSFFAKVIYDAICETNDELYLVSEDYKILGSKNKTKRLNNLASNINLEYKDKEVFISFNTIMEFGSSINNNSSSVLNYIIDVLSKSLREYNIYVEMKVIGVKSKEIAKRDLTFEIKYEP